METKPDKSISIPLTRIIDPVDQLDIALTILNDDDWKPFMFSSIWHYVKGQKQFITEKDLHLAIDKLCDDKYVSLVGDNSELDKSYRITYQGRLFMNSASANFKNRPYRDNLDKERREKRRTTVKTVAGVANTLFVLLIGGLGVYVTWDSSKLNNTIDNQEKKIKIQKITIDSLTTLTRDTTRSIFKKISK